MKKFFFSIMAAVCAMVMSFSSCEKLAVDKSIAAEIKSSSEGKMGAKGLPAAAKRDIVDSTSTNTNIKITFGWFIGGENVQNDTLHNDTIELSRSLKTTMYGEEVEIVKEIGLKSVGKVVLTDTKGTDKPFIDNKRELEEDYVHNVSFLNREGAVETKSLPIHVVYDDIQVTDPQDPNLVVPFPRLSIAVTYTGKEDMELTRAKEKDSESYEYYRATMPYTLKVNGKGEKLSGTMLEALAKVPEPKDEFLYVEEVDKGYEIKSSDENGQTVHSWFKARKVYTSGPKETKTFATDLYYRHSAPKRGLVYLLKFMVQKLQGVLNSEKKSGNTRTDTDGEAEFSITEWIRTFGTGFTGTDTDGTEKKVDEIFNFYRETAKVTIWGETFDMACPDYSSVTTVSSTNSDMDSSEITVDGKTYEHMLNTTKVTAKLDDEKIDMKGETEIRVKKADEPETFKDETKYVGAKRIAANTVYVYAWIIRTSSKEGSKEFERGINLMFYGETDAETEFLVEAFSNDTDWTIASVGLAALVSTRYSGDFTVGLWRRVVVIKDKKNDIERKVTLYYERADLKLLNNGTLEMPYVFFTNDVLKDVEITGLTRSTANTVEYQRQRYTLTLGETAKITNPSGIGDFRNEFVDTPTAFTTSAILKVAKEERDIPNWLGELVDARYTRVQKSSGDDFEDMTNFKAKKGVVVIPHGDKSQMTIFAFNQADADKYGVELAAESQWYSAVWKDGAWIPAMIRDNANREDKAIEDDKKLDSWTYKGRGVAKNVSKANALEKHIGYECTPVPSRQKVTKKDDGSIVLDYYRNNTEKTTASFSLR